MGWTYWCHHLWQIKLATYFSYASFPKSFRLISLSNFFYFPSLDALSLIPQVSALSSLLTTHKFMSLAMTCCRPQKLNSLKTLILHLPAKVCPPLEYLPGTQMWPTPFPNLFCPTFLHMAETTFYNQVTISNSSVNCSEGHLLPWPSPLSSCQG